METGIKHTQLPRVGYTYQDYVCIEKLIDWYHDPEKYNWISIEGTETEDGKLKSLDDVVALNSDGTYELYQVKFTTDANDERNSLSFAWLCQRKKKGSSLLQKWNADIAKYAALGKISRASLKTNRKPDQQFLSCLLDGKIDISRVPNDVLVQVDEQLGGREITETFFAEFSFEHSMRTVDRFEQDLESRLVPDHTSSEGWLRLLKAVEQWATRKRLPQPDGKIVLTHLTEIIAHRNESTLSQFFEIPVGYAPPSIDFHKQVSDGTNFTGVCVISGLPGTGKSTYLSYLTEELLKENKAVIRHHYSIDAHGLSDRISFSNAACSLLAQLRQMVPEINVPEELKPDELEMKISHAANALSDSGRSCLTIIIDGLDHVARERSNISQLEHMINRLLELTDKVHIILGTQPVSNDQLPSKLIAKSPREKWLPLPYMDLSSIKSWLNVQVKKQFVHIRGGEDSYDREISEVSQALLKISNGYPLHLIYSIKTLINQSGIISAYEIEKLPACSEGDIRTYYDNLWSNLSASAREVLVLIASVHFQWPNIESLKFCVKQTDFYASFDEIKHLVEIRRSGIFPFHSSMLVFVRTQEMFRQLKSDCMKQVCVWLDSCAPDFWKWGWTWVAQAEIGNAEPLFKGITYDWSVEGLHKGYPLDHIEHVISFAEEVAFEKRDFGKLTNLRHIRHRVVNGTKFQLEDYSDFLDCALKVHQDVYCLYWRIDNLRTLDDNEIAVIAARSKDVDQDILDDCYDEIRRRLNFFARLQDRESNDRVEGLILAAITTIASYKEPYLDSFFDLLDRLNEKDRFFKLFLDELFRLENCVVVLDIPHDKVPEGAEYHFWDSLLKVCCLEEISFFERFPSEAYFASPLIEFAKILSENASESFVYPAPKLAEREPLTENYFRDFFFFCLFASENSTQIFVEDLPYSIEGKDDAECVLKFLTQEYKKSIRETKIDPLLLLTLFQNIDVKQSDSPHYDPKQSWLSLTSSLALISRELYPILRSIDRLDINPLCCENGTIESWVNPYSLLRHLSISAHKILPKQLAAELFSREYGRLKSNRERTNELCQDGLELAMYAASFGLLEQAKEYLEFSAQNVFGYAWRKDITLSELFDALDACSQAGIGRIPDWLERIAPFVDSVFDFSERENRHIPGEYLKLVSKHVPERMLDEIRYNILYQNWWIAESALEYWVESADVNSVSDVNFLKCMTSFSSIDALKKRAKDEPHLQSIFDEQIQYLGGMPPSPRELRESPDIDENTVKLNFSEYPPQDLEKLNRVLMESGVYPARKIIEDWVRYWGGRERGADIVNVFETEWQRDTCSHYHFSKCLDEVFEISLRLFGKTKSRKWAVRSVQSNGYWNRWNYADDILHRYAEIYAEDWEEFLVETTQSNQVDRLSKGWITVPRDSLIKFLISVKQFDLACEVTAAMLECIEDEIKFLPLRPLYWSDKTCSKSEISARTMLELYRWPDRYSRMRIANQIAKTLDEDPGFKLIFLEHLSQQKYETEVTDLLSVLQLTKKVKFSEVELRSAIHVPSILSDFLLIKLEISSLPQNVSGYHSKIEVDTSFQSKRFERAQIGIPEIYVREVQRLGKRLGFPLLQYMQSEWENISKRKDFFFFDPYNFCGDYFYRQYPIACDFSTSAETVHLSAYLRTLAFAVEKLEFPLNEAMTFATIARPFGGVCSSLLPASPPMQWPKWHEVPVDVKRPDVDVLSGWLKKIADSKQSVLFANGPICRNEEGFDCDLEVVRVHLVGHETKTAEELFHLIEHHELPSGISPYAQKRFVPDMGRWEFAWYLRGFAVPAMNISNLGNGIVVRDDNVGFVSAGFEIAKWQFWSRHWYPVWYQGLGANLGVCLLGDDNVGLSVEGDAQGTDYLIGKLTVLDKRDFRRDNSVIELFAMIKVLGTSRNPSL